MGGVEVKILNKTEVSSGWEFKVLIIQGVGETKHSVILDDNYWDKLKGQRDNPEDLIIDSFKFLLERESKESILKEFNLEVIGKYFPEYEQEINL